MVYPGAVHSRFEHSLGVYWLAGEAVDTIKTYQVGDVIFILSAISSNIIFIPMPSLQGSELGIERSDIQTVKLAGD
jgi:HD superfamily phosphohydrolase